MTLVKLKKLVHKVACTQDVNVEAYLPYLMADYIANIYFCMAGRSTSVVNDNVASFSKLTA